MVFLSLYFKTLSFIERVNQYLYSKYIARIFSCENGRFRYPLNFYKGPEYFKIGSNCIFGRFSVLSAWGHFGKETYTPEVRIGNNCNFGDFLHLTCINQIIIGDGVLTGRWVTISDNNHGDTSVGSLNIAPYDRTVISKGTIIIEDNVWIGDKATILGGVKIGKGSIVAANTVVTKSIPEFSVVAGNPARIINN